MKSKIGCVMIILLCSFVLTGCWGKRDVEKLTPLFAVGVDAGQKPGSFLITEQYALPKQGGASALEIEGWTSSFEVSSARERNEMSTKLSDRVPFLGSLKVFVIGEEAAKAGFTDFLDFYQRFPEFRRTTYIVVAKGKAQDLLNTKLRLGELPSMYLKDNIETADAISAYPVVLAGQYLTALANKSSAPILPLVEIIKPGDKGIEYEPGEDADAIELRLQGAGVFEKDRLAAFLTDKESKGYMWLADKVKYRIIESQDDEEQDIHFTGLVQKTTTKQRVASKDGIVSLEYRIKVTMVVDEVLGLKEQLKPLAWIELLSEAEKSFAREIQKECELALQKERELGADFLNIGRHIEQQNPAYWKTIKDQWEEKIVDFPVSLTVQVKINNSGMSTNSVTVN